MNHVIGFVDQKFNIIDESHDLRRKFNMQVAVGFGDDLVARQLSDGFLQPDHCIGRGARETDRIDLMFGVGILTANAVWFFGAGVEAPLLNTKGRWFDEADSQHNKRDEADGDQQFLFSRHSKIIEQGKGKSNETPCCPFRAI